MPPALFHFTDYLTGGKQIVGLWVLFYYLVLVCEKNIDLTTGEPARPTLAPQGKLSVANY